MPGARKGAAGCGGAPARRRAGWELGAAQSGAGRAAACAEQCALARCAIALCIMSGVSALLMNEHPSAVGAARDQLSAPLDTCAATVRTKYQCARLADAPAETPR
jgi:hypothetical protein